MTQRHAVVFVEPGPAFDKRLDMVDFIRRGQASFLPAHNTEGIVGKIPRSELCPCGVIPTFARRSSPVIVEATGVFVLVLMVIAEAISVRRRATAEFAGSRNGFHRRLSP